MKDSNICRFSNSRGLIPSVPSRIKPAEVGGLFFSIAVKRATQKGHLLQNDLSFWTGPGHLVWTSWNSMAPGWKRIIPMTMTQLSSTWWNRVCWRAAKRKNSLQKLQAGEQRGQDGKRQQSASIRVNRVKVCPRTLKCWQFSMKQQQQRRVSLRSKTWNAHKHNERRRATTVSHVCSFKSLAADIRLTSKTRVQKGFLDKCRRRSKNRSWVNLFWALSERNF